MAVRHDEHAHADPHPFRHAGQKRQRIERIEPFHTRIDVVIRLAVVVLLVRPRGRNLLGQDDVVADQQRVAALVFGDPGHVHQHPPVAHRRPAGQMQAIFHVGPPSSSSRRARSLDRSGSVVAKSRDTRKANGRGRPHAMPTCVVGAGPCACPAGEAIQGEGNHGGLPLHGKEREKSRTKISSYGRLCLTERTRCFIARSGRHNLGDGLE